MIADVDDAAFDEAFVFEGALHDLVVGVCVNTDILRDAFAKIGGGFENTAHRAVSGDTMDRDVRIIVQPFAVFDVTVRRIVARKQRENAVYAIVVINDVTATVHNIINYHFARRISASPLMRIARFDH